MEHIRDSIAKKGRSVDGLASFLKHFAFCCVLSLFVTCVESPSTVEGCKKGKGKKGKKGKSKGAKGEEEEEDEGVARVSRLVLRFFVLASKLIPSAQTTMEAVSGHSLGSAVKMFYNISNCQSPKAVFMTKQKGFVGNLRLTTYGIKCIKHFSSFGLKKASDGEVKNFASKFHKSGFKAKLAALSKEDFSNSEDFTDEWLQKNQTPLLIKCVLVQHHESKFITMQWQIKDDQWCKNDKYEKPATRAKPIKLKKGKNEEQKKTKPRAASPSPIAMKRRKMMTIANFDVDDDPPMNANNEEFPSPTKHRRDISNNNNNNVCSIAMNEEFPSPTKHRSDSTENSGGFDRILQSVFSDGATICHTFAAGNIGCTECAVIDDGTKIQITTMQSNAPPKPPLLVCVSFISIYSITSQHY